nr:MAG TPA: hypothetical protein [Siphoviridae sp. ctqOv4]
MLLFESRYMSDILARSLRFHINLNFLCLIC